MPLDVMIYDSKRNQKDVKFKTLQTMLQSKKQPCERSTKRLLNQRKDSQNLKTIWYNSVSNDIAFHFHLVKNYGPPSFPSYIT